MIPPIPELKLHRNGLLCQVTPEQCQHIARSENAMRNHCSIVHPGVRGSSRAKCKAQRGQMRQEPWKVVNCQQLFVRRQGSQFFEVEALEDEPATAVVEPPRASKIEQARQMLVKRMDKIEDRERRIIEDGTHNAPSPWLTQAGFAQYLRKLDREELLQSVATPEAEEEPICHIIWEAMMEMMRQCQATVNQHAGRFVRKEVMRTEEDQSRFVPLKGYQQVEEIRDKGRHWQQMVIFFVRTQQEHQWKSPKYRFNVHQRDAFQRLIEVAHNEVEQTDQDDDQDDNDRDNDNDRDENDNDNDNDEDEGRKMIYLTGIHQACLEFCIALLCGKARQHEYEHAMVCALAVLGVNERGWMGFDTYPPILSSVIKIGRMMVIQFGFHESRSKEQDEHDDDNDDNEDHDEDEEQRNEKVIRASPSTRRGSEDGRKRREIERKTLEYINIVTHIVNEYILYKSYRLME